MTCPACHAANKNAAKYCFSCGASLAHARRGGKRGRIERFARGKNHVLATVLSLLIAGLGQFYNGDVKKGAFMIGGAAIGGALSAGVLWLGVAVWSAIDAYRVASGKIPLWI